MRAPASSRYCLNPSFFLSISRTPVRSSPKEITFSKTFHFATLKRLVVVVKPMLLSPTRDPELTGCRSLSLTSASLTLSSVPSLASSSFSFSLVTAAGNLTASLDLSFWSNSLSSFFLMRLEGWKM